MENKKIVAIIQARMGSTRLPGKVLKEVSGKPLLWHVINRVKKAKLIDQIVLATTDKKEDLKLIELASETCIESYAGSEEDVLDRYFQAATKYKADIIVRITSDCPLIDPRVIDKVIKHFLSDNFDYVANANIIKCTYPDGLDVEVFSYDALKKAFSGAKLTSEREHVAPYIRDHTEIFKIGSVENDEDISHLRWTVDEERDLEFVREIYKRLYKEGGMFYMENVLELIKKTPELIEINSKIIRNEGYLKSLEKDKS
ncbi:MAG: acylneuraminate cytidylyltransferase [Candidatus Altiarchaeales archaeon HGW-Altiarchaeales-2]|nr:MAG: acylneuraminate cytidylyltransferase [Candidatus Altiarchaeales archaeon HGW-Altiarchaeales-2]